MLLERRIHQHRTRVVEKPWGRFRQFTLNESSTVKMLEVEPGEVLSLQSHRYRDELWVFLDDGAEVHLNYQVLHPREGQEVRIPRGARHRLLSRGTHVRVLEVAFDHFDEDDIIRYDDCYGRVAMETELSAS